MNSDSFKTIEQPSPEVVFKDRKSKFYGLAHPINREGDVKPILESLKKQYPNGNHFCYAWQLGTESHHYRTNDDGEPKNSAGRPIYGQIQAFNVTNILVVVVRVFGGQKLGVGGLVNAYKTASQMTLSMAAIVVKTVETDFELVFDYALMNEVMRAIKRQSMAITSQTMDRRCRIKVTVPRNKSKIAEQEFLKIHGLSIKTI